MKTSKVLKKAKKHLAENHIDLVASYKASFICYAIADTDKVSQRDADRVRNMVQERLAPYATLEGWLSKKHRVKLIGWNDSDIKVNAYKDKMQATRHAWIDSMITEFEAKGD